MRWDVVGSGKKVAIYRADGELVIDGITRKNALVVVSEHNHEVFRLLEETHEATMKYLVAIGCRR